MSTGIDALDARVDALGETAPEMHSFEAEARRQLAQAARAILAHKPERADIGSLNNFLLRLEEAANLCDFSVKLSVKAELRKKAKTSE